MLLVTGASGNVGAELVELLSASRPDSWRIARRHPEANDVTGSGAEVARFDFFDRGTWSAALDGITSLFLLFPLPSNRSARTAIIPFIEAAERAGCRHVVYVSVFGADAAPFIPHHAVEAALRSSAMNSTILRCSFFMQNLHRAISTHGTDIVERGELFIPAGRGRTTFIDARDAAAVAASVLADPSTHGDRVYHLTGRTALSMSEVASELSAVLGRRIVYTSPGAIHFATRLRRRGVGWDTISFMVAVYTLTRLGRNQPITDDVGRLLSRPPRTLHDFVAESGWRFDARAWT